MTDPIADDTVVGPTPVLAVVGRPNVGKSTLVNRIIGRREAVVEDRPGVTRDRVSYDATWNGRAFTVVDTGGWDPDARGLFERIVAQAEVAVSIADAVMFVVDAGVGITDADEAVVKILRRSGKPVVLAANKVDDPRTEAEAYGLWNLGLGEPMPVSALHGRGSGDLLDAVLAALPETPPRVVGAGRRTTPGRDRRQAQRRQVVAAQQAGQGRPGRRRRRRRHHGRPGRRADRARRAAVAVHRHRRHPQAGQGGVRPGVLREPAHQHRDRPGRGGGAGRRRLAADLRAGPADHHDRRRGRSRPGDRVQQVGPRRRGAPLLPRPRDRARPRARAVGAPDQHHREDRLARRPAGAGARRRARGLGDPGRHRRAQRVPRPAGRRAPPPGARRQAAQGAVRDPAVARRRRRSCCSPPASWRRRTSATSSAGCARSSASSARRST